MMKRYHSFTNLTCLFIIHFILIWIHPAHGATTPAHKANTETSNHQIHFTSPEKAEDKIPKSTIQKPENLIIREPLSVKVLKETSWWTTVQKNIKEQEYRITYQDTSYLPDIKGTYQAPNRNQNLRTYFTSKGIKVVSRTESVPTWHADFTLSGLGKESSIVSLPEDKEPKVNDHRIEFHRADVVEWYENRPDGLEQGFTINKKPEGNGPLYLFLDISGNVKPVLSKDGRIVNFLSSKDAKVLQYGNLKAFDAKGKALSSRFEFAGNLLRIVVDDSAANYPIVVDPLLTTPAWTAESDLAFANFGYAVSTAGDVNGDGFSDVIVGADQFDTAGFEGKVFVYYGSATGLPTTANWTAVSDQASPTYFGTSVDTAGDVNGDGYDDIIIAADYYNNPGPDTIDEGKVFVYYGSSSGLSTTADWTAESNQDQSYFGWEVSTAGDVNNDGYDDIIVGAIGYDSMAAADIGAAYVYHGSATGLGPSGTLANADWSAVGTQVSEGFGNTVDTAGDVNGDGFSDVIVGANLYDNGQTDEGAAFVYYGSATGLSATANWTAESNQAGAQFGTSVRSAGDVNGDLYSDVIIGAWNYNATRGGAFVYHGSATGLGPSGTPANADWSAIGGDLNYALGTAVGTAGDVNGDGYSEVIVGAPGDGSTLTGWAYVYYGSATGLSTTADWTQAGTNAGDNFGFAVSTAGDVNGDGFSDVIVGADNYDNGQTDEGAAYLYFGSSISPDPYTWNQVNSDGFGDVNNLSAMSTVVFNNRLYVDTNHGATGCEVWEYDGANWTQVNTDGFGDVNNWYSFDMAVFNNRLYVPTYNQTDGTEVWEYDGTNWTQVNTDGFGDVNNRGTYSMAVYNNRLYAGTGSLTGAEVWEYDGANWVQVNIDGFGNTNNDNALSMAVFNGNLYVGTYNGPDGAQVWEYDGTSWTQANTNGFGDSFNWGIYNMAVFNANLYVGTYNPTNFGGTGGEIWEYDGESWNQANTDGFGDGNNTSASPMAVFNNRLYAGTGNETTGCEVWEYDGANWNQVNIDGFGDGNNTTVQSMAEYNSNLYAGTYNDTTGAEVWEYGLEAPTLNSPPDTPTSSSPADEAILSSGPVTIDTSIFSDPDSGDTHTESHWLVRRADSVYYRADYDPSFDTVITTGDLTQHTVSGLSSGMKYVWKVGYTDSGSGETSWSQEYSFMIGTSEADSSVEINSGTEEADFAMVSFVQWPDHSMSSNVFNLTYDKRYFRIGTYDPTNGSGGYVEYGSSLMIEPGKAYWFLARNGLPITVNGIPVSLTDDIDVGLLFNTSNQNGWNMIGCPNAANYNWNDVQVIEYNPNDGSIVFGPTAISDPDPGVDNLIDRRLWRWESGTYYPDAILIEKYKGYWVKAKKANVFLRFRESVQIASISNPHTMFARLLNNGKRWMKRWIFTPQVAIADSDDSPPRPMGDFSTVSPDSVRDCFIATAVYGSPMERHVKILRDFRDTYLLNSMIGHTFVKAYYRYSPPVADFIAKHKALKAAARMSFLPMVAFCYSALHFGLVVSASGLLLIFMPFIFLVLVSKRRV